MEDSDDGGALAMHHLLARLACASDEGSVDEYQALSTEDAELIVDDPRIAVPGAEVLRGSDQIRATAEKPASGQDERPAQQHLVSTIVAGIDGGVATSAASWLLFRDSDGRPNPVGVGEYRDRPRRQRRANRLSHHHAEPG